MTLPLCASDVLAAFERARHEAGQLGFTASVQVSPHPGGATSLQCDAPSVLGEFCVWPNGNVEVTTSQSDSGPEQAQVSILHGHVDSFSSLAFHLRCAIGMWSGMAAGREPESF